MKENRKPGRMAVDLLLIFIVFLVIQMVVNGLVTLVYVYLNHVDAAQFAQQVASGQQGQFVAATSVLSSLLTIMVYPRLRWTPLDRTYLRSRPWATLVWCGLLTLGTILPFEWVYEQLQIQMADSHQALFESVMREPWGYVALGILAPVAEEFVFRGGLLRTLLSMMRVRGWESGRYVAPTASSASVAPTRSSASEERAGRTWAPWLAIAFSALLFGVVHMNWAQGFHGFIMGLLLGWLYYRTGSMMPGIIVHWVNNTVAYLMFKLLPGMADGQLIDFFHGSERLMVVGLLCSLSILVPSLFQIILRTKK